MSCLSLVFIILSCLLASAHSTGQFQHANDKKVGSAKWKTNGLNPKIFGQDSVHVRTKTNLLRTTVHGQYRQDLTDPTKAHGDFTLKKAHNGAQEIYKVDIQHKNYGKQGTSIAQRTTAPRHIIDDPTFKNG